MTALGAYYATKTLEPIAGLGHLGQAPEQTMSALAANTMQSFLQSIQPLGIYIPWADQVGEHDWKVVSPDQRYALYPVTADILSSAERASFGQPVGFVTVLSAHQLTLADAARLFDGTPFEYFSTDASYRDDDHKSAPTIYFVYWGRLRDTAQTVGNYKTLESQAKAMGVQLAFPVYVNVPADATQPAIDFNLALKAQQLAPTTAAMPTAIAPTPVAPTAIAPAAAVTQKSSGIPSLLLILAVGGVAAYAGYRIMHGGRRRAATVS
jgi:hypothetical protein